MFGFGKDKQQDQCVLIVDIGSGSVGLAIIISDQNQNEPHIVWSYREHALMREVDSFVEAQKIITTAIVNAFLELGSTGLKSLKEFDKNQHISKMQVSIAAPWSYTVTKTVRYTDEKEFTINEELIEELAKTARKDALESMEATDLKKQGLSMITDATVSVNLNGYKVLSLLNQTGKTLELAHVIAVTHNSILEVLNDSREKIIPRASQNIGSFMYSFYCVLNRLNPDTSEIALIDVTNEATEIGIVREGTLQYTTYTPIGSFSLAREISEIINTPKEEAYTYLKGNFETLSEKLSETKQTELEKILSRYRADIALALKETGDKLAIPKTIFLHCDKKTEEFFKSEILKAAKHATNSNHSIHQVTSKLLGDENTSDTAILLSAYFSHTCTDCGMDLK